MRQEDFNTLLGLLGVLLALSIGIVAVAIAVAFAGGLVLGRGWSRS
jgi:hypothetical protein